MRMVAIAICAIAVAGCSGSYESTKRIRDYEIQRLFEQDGCVMYRFYDRGDPHYFLTCPSGQAQTIATRCRWTGKFRVCRSETIQTILTTQAAGGEG